MRHIRIAAQGRFDDFLRHERAFDHLVGGGSMIGFRVPHDMNDVRAQRHLQHGALGQVRARPARVYRVAQQSGARLPPHAEIVRGELIGSIAFERWGGLWSMIARM